MAQPAPVGPKLSLAPIPVANGSNRITAHLDATTTPGALTGGSVNIGESRQIVSTVKAGQRLYIAQAGLSYYFGFVGTTAGVPNNFNGLEVRAMQKGQPRSAIIHVQGTGLRFGTLSFSALEILNLDPANDVQFTMVVGGGITKNSYDEFIDNRVVLSGAGVTTSVTNSPTTSVAFKTRTPAWADSLATGVTQAIADGYLGRARKAVVIGNDDNAIVLIVFDLAGNILGSIQPGTSFYLETGGTVKVNNPGATTVTCHIGEVYYS